MLIIIMEPRASIGGLTAKCDPVISVKSTSGSHSSSQLSDSESCVDICWIIEKAREFQKNIYFCFIEYAKALDCVDHNKLWKILKEMGIPDHLICLLRKPICRSGSNN